MRRQVMRVVMGLWLAAMIAPALAAHEGHPHTVMGTVAAVHDAHLEVKDTKGKLHGMTVTPRTKILRGTAPVKLSEITLDERVVVKATETKGKDGKVTVVANEIRVAAGTTGSK
jgi:hypothetical protein